MGFTPASVILFVVLGAVPQLTEGDRGRLGGAVDGGDYREDAFAALVEHTGRWTPGLGGAAVRLELDLLRVLTDPAANRGALFRLAGKLVQRRK